MLLLVVFASFLGLGPFYGGEGGGGGGGEHANGGKYTEKYLIHHFGHLDPELKNVVCLATFQSHFPFL